MTEGLLYVDSSALVKLVVAEPETPALMARLSQTSNLVSSAVAAVEVIRAARRASTSEAVAARAREVVRAVHLLAVDARVLDHAADLEPRGLRTLDAIHLASALSIRTTSRPWWSTTNASQPPPKPQGSRSSPPADPFPASTALRRTSSPSHFLTFLPSERLASKALTLDSNHRRRQAPPLRPLPSRVWLLRPPHSSPFSLHDEGPGASRGLSSVG